MSNSRTVVRSQHILSVTILGGLSNGETITFTRLLHTCKYIDMLLHTHYTLYILIPTTAPVEMSHTSIPLAGIRYFIVIVNMDLMDTTVKTIMTTSILQIYADLHYLGFPR